MRATFDRARLAWRMRLHPGLRVSPRANAAFAVARYQLAAGARLRIDAHAVTERIPGALAFVLHPGAVVTVGERAWLRTEVAPLVICAFAGARIRIGADTLLNGCTLSAKRALTLKRGVFIGPGSRLYDADQHDFDATHPERVAPVTVGEHAWLASDVTVLRGVRIGAHSVVGARSVVTRDLPAHSFATGAPARVRGKVGDRTGAK